MLLLKNPTSTHEVQAMNWKQTKKDATVQEMARAEEEMVVSSLQFRVINRNSNSRPHSCTDIRSQYMFQLIHTRT